VWDGVNGLGNTLPEGSYKLAVNARKADGTAIPTAITGVGLVKEVDMSGVEPMVTIANRIVKLSEILGLKN
jgi:flagellar basal-body rod modification protein FlgD